MDVTNQFTLSLSKWAQSTHTGLKNHEFSLAESLRRSQRYLVCETDFVYHGCWVVGRCKKECGDFGEQKVALA